MNGITNTQTLFGRGVSSATEATATQGTEGAKTGRPGTTAPAAAVDTTAGKVQVSTAAGALLNSDGDVRMDKVASLQKAIHSGSYNVSSTDVADKLIGTMLGLH